MELEFNLVSNNNILDSDKPINDNSDLKNENKLEINTNQFNYLDSMLSYTVSDYDENCEEHFKINNIIPIKKDNLKFIFFIFLNIITCFVINLIIIWFPILKLKLIYSHVPLSKATYVYISCKDGENYIISLKKIKLPKISNNSFLKTEYKSNLNNNNENITILFIFKLFTYVFDYKNKCFVSFQNIIETTYNNLYNNCTKGLTKDEILHQKYLYGVCDLEIIVNSFFKLLFIEFTDPFYSFQLFSIILWYNNEYKLYATVILFTSLFSLIYGTYETRKNLLNLQRMAKYSCEVNVKRINENNETKFVKINSRDLVPGDLFEVQNENFAMPCDCILLNGSVIINEAMLTGESTPIIKNQIQKINSHFNLKEEKKNFLFAGTKLIQKKLNNKNDKVLALVYNIGFNTSKGNLIRSIIYPKNINIKFKEDSIKYICLMGCLSIIGFIISIPFLKEAGQSNYEIIIKCLDLITIIVPPSLPACIGIGISYAVNRLKSQQIICINRDRVNLLGKINTIVFDKTGTLTEDHLEIYGFCPVKMESNNFIFDNFIKDAKDIASRTYSYYKKKKLTNEKELNDDLNLLFVECLASCHSATIVNNTVVGDPIDINMFQSCDWKIYENQNNNELDNNKNITTFYRYKDEKNLDDKLKNLKDKESKEEIIKQHYELGVIRRFDFSSKLQRMSVIIQNSNEDYFKLFCKGSPEKIEKLCKSDTIPKNFNKTLRKYTSKGLRVLGICFKMVKMTYEESQGVLREDMEKNMTFLGLLIVRNKLKERTKPSLEVLHSAGLRMVMATGDNILTAITISREAKLIRSDSEIMTCEIENNNLKWDTIENFDEFDNENEEINNSKYSDSIDNESEKKLNKSIHRISFSNKFPPEKFSIINLPKNNHNEDFAQNQNEILIPQNNENNNNLKINEKIDIDEDEDDHNIEIQSNPFKNNDKNDYIIAIEGSTFEKLYKLRNLYLSKKSQEYKIYYDIFKNILRYGYIFSRMAPEHKAMLVEALKEEKLTVCMCGDGANDCTALRTAHVGVSLSSEEASIAAPFTSNIPDISCLITILKEGKAALVTSIQIFKYMMIYSLIQYICIIILNINESYLSDWQFLAVDLFIIIPLAFLIPYTKAYPILTEKKPTDSLISFPIICSILVQILITFIFQYGGYLALNHINWDHKEMILDCELTEDGLAITCPLNTVIFLISNIQYLITALAFTVSKPFKQPFYTNLFLTGYLLFSFIYSLYLIIGPFENFSRKNLILYELNDIDKILKFFILIMVLANLILSYLYEKKILPFLIKIWNKFKLKKLIEKSKQSDFEYNLSQLQTMNINKKIYLNNK